MSQAVGVLCETKKGGELVGDGNGSMHAGQLVGGETRGIGLESQRDQVEHGVNQLARSLIVGIESEPFGIDLGLGYVKPTGGTFDVLLDFAHRGEVLVELVLVGLAKLALQGLGLAQEKVEVTARSGQPFSLSIDRVSLKAE